MDVNFVLGDSTNGLTPSASATYRGRRFGYPTAAESQHFDHGESFSKLGTVLNGN